MSHSESLQRRSGEVRVEETDASIRYANGHWFLKLIDIGETEIPIELGRTLVAAAKLKTGYLNKIHSLVGKRSPTIYRRRHWFEKTPVEKWYWGIDCHLFVARALGFKDVLKNKAKGFLDYTANHQFFDNKDFVSMSSEELKNNLLGSSSNINVIQIKNRGLTHSCISIRFGSEVIIVEAPGYANVGVDKLESRYKLWNSGHEDDYGTNFAFAPYSKIAARKDLMEYYRQYHGTG